jgi:Na+/proline symporter
MFRLLWIASTHVRIFMRRYMPSTIILDYVRTRRGLKWGPVVMLLAAPYAVAAYWLTAWIEGGGPEWLYLLVLVCLWSAFKMIWIGLVSLVVLARTRHAEARCRGAVPSPPPGTLQQARSVRAPQSP